MTTVFLSDIHISDQHPEISKHLEEFLLEEGSKTDAIFVLGDLFEYWLGDDDPNPLFREIKQLLKRLSDKNISIFFIHGNRDFLIGESFAEETGCHILNDPHIIDLCDKRVLISHGDMFCTDDKEYQLFRNQTRDPAWKEFILSKSLSFREEFAKQARLESSKHISSNKNEIMDVNKDEILKMYEKYNVDIIIHGHTHRPAIHDVFFNGRNCQRIVLGDWYEQGSILKCDETGFDLIELDRK
tara:strand:- start:1428 stop:2153 length:726 start_codon:yes stop_codon:yes gene_type:complete